MANNEDIFYILEINSRIILGNEPVTADMRCCLSIPKSRANIDFANVCKASSNLAATYSSQTNIIMPAEISIMAKKKLPTQNVLIFKLFP